MQVTLQDPGTPPEKPRASTFTIGLAVVVAALAAGFWLLLEQPRNRKAPSATGSVHLKMNPAEQEFSRRIEVGNLALSRAENFLHQEVTILNGEVYNGGTEPVLSLGLTTEFFDDLNQVVLRETRGVLGTGGLALAPGERRTFEISFDHVPNSWNMQTPAVRVEYLQLPARK
jgi:hypothetical protein